MVLEKLGGCAYLTDICILAKYYIGDSSKAKDVKNNIRRELNSNPELFCHVEGKPDGWWQLKSRKDEIAELKAKLAEREKVIDEQRKIPTEDDFIRRLLEKLRTVWRDEKKTINEFRKILDAMGRSDIVEELDRCMEDKAKKYTSPNIVVQGDYVVDKHVENEVSGFQIVNGKDQPLTVYDKDIKAVIKELQDAKDEKGQLIFKNKKQWWAVFRVLSTYCNYPSQKTAFEKKMKELEVAVIDGERDLTYDSLSKAPTDVPRIATCSPSTWNTCKDINDNYMQQYIVAEFLMLKLGIKS